MKRIVDTAKLTFWHVRVHSRFDEQLNKFIEDTTDFTSKSEFIRAAVRDRLKAEKEKNGDLGRT